MSHGKTIELFLVNGTTDIITAQIDNWNGKAIKYVIEKQVGTLTF